MLRHFCWRKRATLSSAPRDVAEHDRRPDVAGSRPPIAWKIVHNPSGTTTCETIEM
jgi:hypothetical protein